MVHLLLYADTLEIEGLISSPWGAGRKQHILNIIQYYETDYPKLKAASDRYPTADYLRSVTKQGAIYSAGYDGFGQPTEGSAWIIQCAKRNDPRPLWVLTWGGIDDLAQALHDDPSIKQKIRVYSICGPNKKWSTMAYNYIETYHRDLWIIENNSTYRGWFVGGNQSGSLSNSSFVSTYINGRGALGNYFAGLGSIKMGDTPSVVYLLGKNPLDPSQESWGGSFVRAWNRPKYTFESSPTSSNKVETYSIVDVVIKLTSPAPAGTTATWSVGGDTFPAGPDSNGNWHFLFSPKQAGSWTYSTKSSYAPLNGKTGAFTSVNPAPELAFQPSSAHPNWWADNLDPSLSEGIYQGVKTVNKWREAFLGDFAARFQRCK
jgi:hypothetical protein